MKEDHLGGALVRNSILYTVGTMIPPAMNVVLLPLFTRFLTPREFGIYAYTTAITVFVTAIATLSIHEYVLRSYFACSTDDERRELFGTLFWFLVAFNVALLGIELAVLPSLFGSGGFRATFRPYMHLVYIATAIESVAVIPLAYFRVREQPIRYVFLFASQTFLNLGFSAFLVVGHRMGVIGRYYGTLAADVLMFVVYLAMMLRVGRFRWKPGLLRAAIRFSVPLVPAAFLWAATSMADRFVLERYVSLAQLGLYSLGFSIGFGLNALVTGIYQAVEPRIYQAAAESHLDETTQRAHRAILAIMLVVGSLVIALSREIVTLLAAPAYRESYKVVVFIVCAVAIRGLATASGTYTMAILRTRSIPLVILASAASGLIVDLLLIPRLGIYGAGYAAIVSAVVLLLGYKVVNERHGAVRWHVARELFMAGCTFGVAFLILQLRMPLLISVPTKAGLVALLGFAVFCFIRWRSRVVSSAERS